MGMETQQFNETKLEPKIFIDKSCTQGKKTVPHEKLLPACQNVTKQNCVTLWETDAAGNQVWAGNDDCEPVTWQECKLVPKDVQFIVPEVTCSDHPERKIYYCRLVRLGLWEPVHNKPCRKIFHNKLCRKHYKTLRVGKHSTTSMVENIPQQSWWETFYNKLSGIIFE